MIHRPPLVLLDLNITLSDAGCCGRGESRNRLCDSVDDDDDDDVLPKKKKHRQHREISLFNLGHIAFLTSRPLRLSHCLVYRLSSNVSTLNAKLPSFSTFLPFTVHSLPHLTVLSLSGCSKITDDGVELIAENLQKLRALDLSWCPRITDAALEYIACDLNMLEELTLDR